MTFHPFQSAFQPPAKVGAKGGAKPPSNPRPTPCSNISPYPYGVGTPARAGSFPALTYTGGRGARLEAMQKFTRG